MTQPLSPAAQSVLDALLEAKFGKGAVELSFPVMSVILGRELAAALRALADQVVPLPRLPYDSCCDVHTAAIRAEILAIAAELEGGNG